MKRTIAVAGTIGAGKTSLVTWLVKRYGLVPFFEPNEANPYLADFYADMKRWAFHSQCFFLAHKLELHQGLEKATAPAVIDPDVLIALTCALPAAKKRIRQRGRGMEKEIPHAYLKRLHGLYEAWFEAYDLSPIVRIDTTKMDYVEDLVDLIELTRKIDGALG